MLFLLLIVFAVALSMVFLLGWRPKKAIAFFLAVFMAVPCYGWGGDGFLLPFRGARVGSRCAKGQCAFSGPRRRSAAAMASSGAYGNWGQSCAVQSSGGSSGSSGYASAQQGVYDIYGNYWPGESTTVGYGSAGSTGNVQKAAAASECKCDCENCTRNRLNTSTKDTSQDAAFKDSLSMARRDPFKEQLHLARKVDRPAVYLASN